MINLNQSFGGVFNKKSVLITGHTGFKGAWLAEWLLKLGAQVTGFALEAPSSQALSEQIGLPRRIRHIIGDVRDRSAVQSAVEYAQPDFIFHLAAQPLVRLSYECPVETYATNIMGTVHLLEAVRLADRPCVVIAITTDKCYENKEWLHAYREEDALGGYDPYSSSKGAAELAISAYRKSYFSGLTTQVCLASARAGNVIGGGDWAQDRIVPDCVRAMTERRSIPVRNRIATRPWQHVLEPLSGYLWLAACMRDSRLLATRTANSEPQRAILESRLRSSFNFGPNITSNRTVADLVQEFLKHWPGRWEDCSDPAAVHEATFLNLSTDKAFHLLGWQPIWNFAATVEHTVSWYREVSEAPQKAGRRTISQIEQYEADARNNSAHWAVTTLPDGGQR